MTRRYLAIISLALCCCDDFRSKVGRCTNSTARRTLKLLVLHGTHKLSHKFKTVCVVSNRYTVYDIRQCLTILAKVARSRDKTVSISHNLQMNCPAVNKAKRNSRNRTSLAERMLELRSDCTMAVHWIEYIERAVQQPEVRDYLRVAKIANLHQWSRARV